MCMYPRVSFECVCLFVDVHAHVCMCTRVSVCARVCGMWAWAYACMRVCDCMRVCINIKIVHDSLIKYHIHDCLIFHNFPDV